MRARPGSEAAGKKVAATADHGLGALAKQIRSWRARNGLTQADLAVASGISVSFISMIERAERSPSYETLVDLAKALELPMSELFRGDGEAPVDDGFYRKLVDFARQAHLSRMQVEQLIAVGRAMFEVGETASAPKRRQGEVALQSGRRCAVAGCGRPLLARGLCPSHYRRRLREKRGVQTA